MPVSISGSGPITGLTSIASPTTLNGLTIPTTGFGKVLQVVYGSTATETSTTSSAYSDTGLTATITPSSASSTILVLASHTTIRRASGNSNGGIQFKLFRNATEIASTSGPFLWENASVDRRDGGPTWILVDSPATTSAVTYKTQFMSNDNASSVSVQWGNTQSGIVLVEVGP